MLSRPAKCCRNNFLKNAKDMGVYDVRGCLIEALIIRESYNLGVYICGPDYRKLTYRACVLPRRTRHRTIHHAGTSYHMTPCGQSLAFSRKHIIIAITIVIMINYDDDDDD